MRFGSLIFKISRRALFPVHIFNWFSLLFWMLCRGSLLLILVFCIFPSSLSIFSLIILISKFCSIGVVLSRFSVLSFSSVSIAMSWVSFSVIFSVTISLRWHICPTILSADAVKCCSLPLFVSSEVLSLLSLKISFLTSSLILWTCSSVTLVVFYNISENLLIC